MQPLVITVEDTRAGTSARYAFIRSPVRLGRREDNDVTLQDPFVSARHGLIQFDASEIRYTDLGSRNGSVLDGVPLEGDEPQPVATGSELCIGALRLSFSRGARRTEAPVRREEADVIRPGALTSLLERIASTPDFDTAQVWAGSLRSGMVIGRFELMRELGRGGFGIVFEARDRQLGRRVALKALRPRENATATVREELVQREAEAAAQLNHPNIVTLFDVGAWDGGPYLILELLRGEALEARLGRGPLPLTEALQVSVDVARALAHAHAAGVVHRDLKPSNVFLTEGGWAKVLDFGLAHAFGAGPQLEGGTPRYMSPEQRGRGVQDGRTDVFSTALVLAETLAGKLPASSDAEPPEPASVIAALPAGSHPSLVKLITRALSVDPVARPADGAAWLEALLGAQREIRASSGALD